MRTCKTICIMAALLFAVRATSAATIPAGVSDIVRQLQEWRDVSVGWLNEASTAFATNSEVLRPLRARYIEASAIANSLVAQFQLETAARTPMDPKRYQKHVERARVACESLSIEARKLLLSGPDPAVKIRGAASNSTVRIPKPERSSGIDTNTAVLIMTGVDRTVKFADNFMDVVLKNRRAFLELNEKQRREVNAMLEATKWTPLNTTAGREPRK